MIRPGDIVYLRVRVLQPNPVAVTAAWRDGAEPIVTAVEGYQPVEVIRPCETFTSYLVRHLGTDRVVAVRTLDLSANPD